MGRRYQKPQQNTPVCPVAGVGRDLGKSVLDTCVLINAMEADYSQKSRLGLHEVHAHHVLRDVIDHDQLYATRDTLGELKRMIVLSNFTGSKIPAEERRRFYLFVERNSHVIEPAAEGKYPHCPTDPDDDIIVAAACSKEVNVNQLVSFNYDLLNMGFLGKRHVAAIAPYAYISRLIENGDPSKVDAIGAVRFHQLSSYPSLSATQDMDMSEHCNSLAPVRSSVSKPVEISPSRPSSRSPSASAGEAFRSDVGRLQERQRVASAAAPSAVSRGMNEIAKRRDETAGVAASARAGAGSGANSSRDAQREQVAVASRRPGVRVHRSNGYHRR